MTFRPAWPTAFVLMLAALLWPALWNGFPIIFADTGGYLERSFAGDLAIGRSALYGLFLRLGIGLDFWPNVVVQAALTVWVLLVCLRAHGLGRRPWSAAGLVALLCVVTALPWYVSQLMPDCFLPLAVLALHLLAFRAHKLRIGETIGLAALIGFAIASHMGTLAIGLALLVAFLLWRAVARWLTVPRPALGVPLLSLAAGVGLALLSNFAIAGQLAFTPGGASFLFGRLIQDGIVARYLAEHCPDPTIRLCEYRAQLPRTADDWLWSNETPFWKLGGPENYEPEERRIIAQTIIRYPADHLRAAIKTAVNQLALVKTTASVSPAHNRHAIETLSRIAPGMMPRLRAARQQQEDGFELAPERMPWLRNPVGSNDAFVFVAFNIVHVPVAFLSVALLILIVVLGALHRARPSVAALALTVLLAIVGNAAIAGIFSNPVDRYQSRLIWLSPFAVAIAVRNGGVAARGRLVSSA